MHGRPPITEGLLRRARLRLREVPERHGLGAGRRIHRVDGRWRAALALLEKLPQAGRDRSFEALAAEAGWRRQARPDVHGLLRAYVEGFNAAPADRIGMQSLRQQTLAAGEIEGDRLFRVEGGYAPLVDFLAARARRAGATIRLGVEARAVAWRRGTVTDPGARPPRRAPAPAARADRDCHRPPRRAPGPRRPPLLAAAPRRQATGHPRPGGRSGDPHVAPVPPPTPGGHRRAHHLRTRCTDPVLFKLIGARHPGCHGDSNRMGSADRGMAGERPEVRRLLRREGILCGTSSALGVAAWQDTSASG